MTKKINFQGLAKISYILSPPVAEANSESCSKPSLKGLSNSYQDSANTDSNEECVLELMKQTGQGKDHKLSLS